MKKHLYLIATISLSLTLTLLLAGCMAESDTDSPVLYEPVVEQATPEPTYVPDGLEHPEEHETDYTDEYEAEPYYDHEPDEYLDYVYIDDNYFELYRIEGTADLSSDMWERMVDWRTNAVLLAERHRDSVVINRNPNAPVVYLTFDDGPDPVNTVSVINTLIEHDVSATFFFLGENIRRHPEVVMMAYEAGFTIGLHGYTHTSFRLLSDEEIIAELNETNDLLEYITGSRATTMRPPYGAIGDEEVEVIRNLDLTIYLWSLDTLDWAQTEATEILRNIKEYTRPGEIILMHAFSGQRLVPEILSEIIVFLLDEGFDIRAL
ncbi:MAG: polysaccharide deacetylase family protein [Oscillospiraceae bacterium]|nr:polysaccharide deacetylase family protein [Oscillospiraceae bacterium]